MRNYEFNPEKYKTELMGIISLLLHEAHKLEDGQILSTKIIDKALKQYPKDKSDLFSRDHLTAGIEYIKTLHLPNIANKELDQLIDLVKLKPMRTQSGVTTVTVLTKPFMCPGECIFCPNDVRMPKSYIASEPGAQRALANRFSPYLQTWNRLKALQNIGHPTNKIELLVLGGTWSSYPEKYQIWFISECFRAMNEFGARETGDKKQETKNEEIGDLRLETRGEYVDQAGTPAPEENETSSLALNEKLITYNVELKTSPIRATTYSLLPTSLHSARFETSNSGFLYEQFEPQIREYLKSDWNDELRKNVGDLPYNTLIKTKEFQDHFSQFICSEDSALIPSEGWMELDRLQDINSRSKTRCVGLVLETRPDSINDREVYRLRRLGATKIQLGIQTLDDRVSEMNKRGEGRKETALAFNLLRAAGFKIHAHIMPNLYGASPEIDREVYRLLFELPDYKPDEVKIYPTSVIKHTELHTLYEEGKYHPYTTHELVDLIADMMEMTPEYCRLTRIIRDIPSTEIEAGNKTTNLREVVEHKLAKEGRANPNIRDREIKNEKVTENDLALDIIEYETTNSIEFFLQYITSSRKIAGFLRLSIPIKPESEVIASSQKLPNSITRNSVMPELADCAIIREVHVYGPSLTLGKDSSGEAQHLGLGTKLIHKAKEMAAQRGFKKLAVISAIGTREYYAKRGFKLHQMYQIASL